MPLLDFGFRPCVLFCSQYLFSTPRFHHVCSAQESSVLGLSCPTVSLYVSSWGTLLSPSISFFVGTESWAQHVSGFPLRTGGHVCLQSPSGISFLSCDEMWLGETIRLLVVVRNSWHWVAFTEEEMKHHACVYFCLGDKWSLRLTDRQQNG